MDRQTSYLRNKYDVSICIANKQQLQKLKVIELRDILREKGLKVSGNKSDLIDRLCPNQDPSLHFSSLSLLPLDIIKEIILYLPITLIFKFIQTNKKYYSILQDKLFWRRMVLKEITEKIEIPIDADIEWYKDKLRYWPSVKHLADLIRFEIKRWDSVGWLQKRVCPGFIHEPDSNWTNFEILENLKTLSCRSLKLKSLPPMPNLVGLDCSNNQLTSLPPMPNLEGLYCLNNQITSLMFYPKLENLYCQGNKLNTLPLLPKLVLLYCGSNNLSTIPEYPNLIKLYCKGNNLPFTSITQYKKWKKNN